MEWLGRPREREVKCNQGRKGAWKVRGKEGSREIPIENLANARASLVAQTVKNQPAMQETWVWSLGWEDTLYKVMAIHSSILAWRIPHGQKSLMGCTPWGSNESDTTEWLSTAQATIPVTIQEIIYVKIYASERSLSEKCLWICT